MSRESPYRSRAPQGPINEAISMLDTIGRPDLGTAVKRLWELCPPIWREQVIAESRLWNPQVLPPVTDTAPPLSVASPPLPFVGAAGTPSESDADLRADWAADADREEQER